jgi:uncharacterized protein (DUF58 family)
VLLEPEFLERLERLSLRTRERLAGAYPGGHRSRRLGSSVDFADWRAYVRGDDFRRIDYQIYARLDRLLIRLYEAEDEVVLHAVVDASTSMGYERKLRQALRLTGALCYLAATRGDRARVWVLDGDGVRPSPWARSRDSAVALLAWLEVVEAKGAADLDAGLARVAAGRGFGGITVLVSDLLTENWEAALRRVSGPHGEGALIQVLARSELEPGERGDLLLVDSESAARIEVSVSDQILRRYRERALKWSGSVAETCRRRNLRYALVHPDDDLQSLLLVRLRGEGLVGL